MLPALSNQIKKSSIWEWLTAPKYNTEDVELYELIRETRLDIDVCRHNYELTSDETLVDMYIYAIMAHEMRYKHLLRLAKRRYEQEQIEANATQPF